LPWYLKLEVGTYDDGLGMMALASVTFINNIGWFISAITEFITVTPESRHFCVFVPF